MHFLLAGGFAVLGILATLAVWLKDRKQECAANDDLESAAAVAATAAEPQSSFPPRSPREPPAHRAALAILQRSTSRNWPLVHAGGIALLILGAPEARYDPRATLQY